MTETARHLEGEEQDGFEHQEGDEVGDRPKLRDGRRDQQIDDQQQARGDDERTVVAPDRAGPGRLAGGLAHGPARLEHDDDVIEDPQQHGDGNDRQDDHLLRLHVLREADTEADCRNDQRDGEIDPDHEEGARDRDELVPRIGTVFVAFIDH